MGRATERDMRTLNELSYNLITLLHRNDTMGMAAGIESRFPFLDERLVGAAINLPLRHKVRFSPTVWEKARLFTRDKWVVRCVADRYLPKELSQRKKLPFVAPALGRMRFRKEFFVGSFVADYLQLSSRELDHLFETAEQRLKVRLLMLDVWGRIFISGMSVPAVRDSLKQQAYFESSPA
jgi:asparagine synthase (glutamine-hydrolysing)